MNDRAGGIRVDIGPGPEHDTTITFPEEPTGSFWATIDPGPDRPMLSLGITSTDEGIIISIYAPHGEMAEPLYSTYIFDQEIIDALTGGQDGAP